MLEGSPKQNLLPPSFMADSVERRNEPLIVDKSLKEIKICIWNAVCKPVNIPELNSQQRLQPSICTPCKEYLLAGSKK